MTNPNYVKGVMFSVVNMNIFKILLALFIGLTLISFIVLKMSPASVAIWVSLFLAALLCVGGIFIALCHDLWIIYCKHQAVK
ncbi:MAG: hypothetical protein QXR73_01600 [Candidatus Micrarchaeaceae archaeon]